MAESDQPRTVKAVETSFRIVEALRHRRRAGVSELSSELDVPVSTTYVHLNTLRELGYVVKSGNDYRLSLRFLEHGGSVRQHLEYFGVVEDSVNRTAYLTGEIAGFAIEEQGQRVIISRSEGRGAIGDQIPIGEYTHLHWTSLGKAIMAHLPRDRVDEIVDEHGLPRGTPNTITDRAVLAEELATIRQTGYAIDNAERRRGIRGISVPVKDANEEIVGALGVAGPKQRFDEAHLGELLSVLEEKQNVIEIRSEYYK